MARDEKGGMKVAGSHAGSPSTQPRESGGRDPFKDGAGPDSRRHWRVALLSSLGLAVFVAAVVLSLHRSQLHPKTLAEGQSQPPRAALASIPSIAVLPFANLSGDPNQKYFCDGITDELTTMLSRLSHLLVIARTSTFAYKSRPAKVQDIGRELGVKYLLEGSVRKSNDQVRIEARLVEAPTGAELWADRFDRPLTDIFALQDHIVQSIVTTLKLQVGLSERGIFARQTTDNLEAYNDFLRGLELRWRETKDGDANALKLFEKAVQLDPNYADASSK